MGIRARIVALAFVAVISVMTMALIVAAGSRNSDRLLQRVIAAHNELEATTELAVQTNHYSEQIAERLLIGDAERPDFEQARVKMTAAFDSLRQATETTDQLERRPGQAGRQAQPAIDLMRTMYRQVDRAAERVFLLRDEGRQDEAVALFRLRIENRQDKEFNGVVNAVMAGERRAVAEATERFRNLQRTLAWAGAIAAVLLLGASIGFALLLARSLTRPIRELTEGALAIGRGDLERRIRVTGNHELALLGTRFNEMAEDLSRQQRRLLGAQAHLEEQVAQRTAQLAEANTRLRELDESRVRFIGDIGHELRTPLTSLRGEAEVTLRGGPKAEEVYRAALEHTVARAGAMGQLVDDLLFMARTESDQIRIERLRISVRELIDAAGQEAVILARSKRIDVKVTLPDASLNMVADERRLHQALIILIDNAIRYSSINGEISIDARGDDEAVQILVRDHGIGITTEDEDHVFERFYRGAEARRQEPSGSGLGLPIAQWIAEQHGGSVSLTSASGTTVARMRLPTSASR